MVLIEVKNLTKLYTEKGAKTPALRGVSFEIQKGEFVAIMGPSGSGKSTLLHILGFLDRPTSGEYFFEAKSIDEYSDEELAQIRNKKMGFVFQMFNLLPRITVFENVKLPLFYSNVSQSFWNEMTFEAIKSVELAHRLTHEPAQLSGGEKQRVAIARAFVNNPQIIFADEPTGNLDSRAGKVIMEILQKLNQEKGHTIILVTHETYTAECAKRIIYLRDGLIESDKVVDNRRNLHEFIK